jgi:hypothetical protein
LGLDVVVPHQPRHPFAATADPLIGQDLVYPLLTIRLSAFLKNILEYAATTPD